MPARQSGVMISGHEIDSANKIRLDLRSNDLCGLPYKQDSMHESVDGPVGRTAAEVGESG